MDYIPLEKPIAELEIQIESLRHIIATQGIDFSAELAELQDKAARLRQEMFSKLSPYEITQLSRHPKRPNSLELIANICDSFIELHGDRGFFDDPALIGGLAKIGGLGLVVLGHQKGRGTKENIARNFGMPKPEGYRKALRIMRLAQRFGLPLLTFIDTPGAYPGVGAEERGQSEAIGQCITEMAGLTVPVVSVVTGEGGSGGALALAVANRVHMLEYATYSVISPEGCASILMKDATRAAEVAEALKMTASYAKTLGVIDEIIPEPVGGAHLDPAQMAERIKEQVLNDFRELSLLTPRELRTSRHSKFLAMGAFGQEGAAR